MVLKQTLTISLLGGGIVGIVNTDQYRDKVSYIKKHSTVGNRSLFIIAGEREVVKFNT